MVRQGKKNETNGKMLDYWEAPRSSMTPIGCLATTYTFSPAFFEEECVGRFLNLETDPKQDGPYYLIEREEKLAQLLCACAIVDQHHCEGARSLRWDLISARPAQGILHAKIVILLWTDYLRIIVSSANLTEDGYRRNQEVFGVLDYFPSGTSPNNCLVDIVQFVRDCLETSASDPTTGSLVRADALLKRVEATPENWGNAQKAKSAPFVSTLFTSPGRSNAFEQLAAIWPVASPPNAANITSPFFDVGESDNPPARKIWELLVRRGYAHVTYNVIAESLPNESAIFLHAPITLRDAQPRGSRSIETEFRTIDPNPQRALHAKTLLLSGEEAILYMLGSSNFTSRGMGLSHHSNLEANLVYGARREQHASIADTLMAAQIESSPLEQGIEVRFKTAKEEEDSPSDVCVLPAFFVTAAIKLESANCYVLVLTFGHAPPPVWTVLSEEGTTLYLSTSWVQEASSHTIEVLWTDSRLPSGLWVEWDDGKRAWWPVNVASQEQLPPPEGLRELSLDFLMRALTSARPLHAIMEEYRKANGLSDVGIDDEPDSLDPHKRVNTTNFLLQRTRRVSGALRGLRERLERPVQSEASLQWRLRGPIGVVAFVNALRKSAGSNEERLFLMAEVILELRRVRAVSGPGCLAEDAILEGIASLESELLDEVTRGTNEVTGNLAGYLARVAGTEGNQH